MCGILSTDFFLISVRCLVFDDLLDHFTAFQGFVRTIVEHENDSLEGAVSRNVVYNEPADSRQPD